MAGTEAGPGRSYRAGVVGYGRIGAIIAERLAVAGLRPLVVDADSGRTAALPAGMQVAAGVVELGRRCDAIFLALPTPTSSLAVALDPGSGLVSSLRPGSLVVDLSTNSLDVTRRLHGELGAASIDVLDSPITLAGGAEEPVTLMVGGTEPVFQRALPLLLTLTPAVLHMGPPGSGTVAKLVTQAVGFANLVCLAEGVLLAGMHGVDPAGFLQLLPRSVAASRMVAPLEHYLATRTTADEPTGGLATIAKDLQLAAGLEHLARLRFRSWADAATLFAEARAAGWDESHYAKVIDLLERTAGYRLPGSDAAPDDR